MRGAQNDSGVRVTACQYGTDDIGRKPPPGKKPVLAGVFTGFGRGFGKPALPDLLRPGVFGALQLAPHGIELGLVDALLAQGLDNAQGALTRRLGPDVTLDITAVGLPLPGRQLIEHGFDHGGVFGVRCQFAPEFGP